MMQPVTPSGQHSNAKTAQTVAKDLNGDLEEASSSSAPSVPRGDPNEFENFRLIIEESSKEAEKITLE